MTLIFQNDLLDVAAAMLLFKKIVFCIRVNFVTVTVYSLVGIPVAAGIFMPFGLVMQLWMASAAMTMTIICVCSGLISTALTVSVTQH